MAYTQEEKQSIINDICKDIESGLSLRKSLINAGISSQTFYAIIEEDEEKSKQYTRASDLRTHLKFESIEEDYMEAPQRDAETGKIDPAWVNLQRLKIDAKKWELSKLMPKKYGDKLDIEQSGEITISFND